MTKHLIGLSIGNYTFDPISKTITLGGVPSLRLEQILCIINATRGTMLYAPIKANLGASISDNIIQLICDTTSMSANDNLQIFVETDDIDTNTTSLIAILKDLCVNLKQFILNNARPAWWDASQNRIRQTGIIESGTITTVTTAANVVNLNGWQSHLAIMNGNVSSWQLTTRSKIT